MIERLMPRAYLLQVSAAPAKKSKKRIQPNTTVVAHIDVPSQKKSQLLLVLHSPIIALDIYKYNIISKTIVIFFSP